MTKAKVAPPKPEKECCSSKCKSNVAPLARGLLITASVLWLLDFLPVFINSFVKTVKQEGYKAKTSYWNGLRLYLTFLIKFLPGSLLYIGSLIALFRFPVFCRNKVLATAALVAFILGIASMAYLAWKPLWKEVNIFGVSKIVERNIRLAVVALAALVPLPVFLGALGSNSALARFAPYDHCEEEEESHV